MRRAVTVALWYALLFGFWELLVGTFNSTELFAGLIAAAVGTAFAALLLWRGLLGFPVDAASCLQLVKLAWQLPVEMCVLAWVLVSSLARGRRVRGRWVTAQFEGGPGRRVLGTVAGTATPNGIVVDITDGEALLHSLAPQLPGGREVL